MRALPRRLAWLPLVLDDVMIDLWRTRVSWWLWGDPMRVAGRPLTQAWHFTQKNLQTGILGATPWINITQWCRAIITLIMIYSRFTVYSNKPRPWCVKNPFKMDFIAFQILSLIALIIATTTVIFIAECITTLSMYPARKSIQSFFSWNAWIEKIQSFMQTVPNSVWIVVRDVGPVIWWIYFATKWYTEHTCSVNVTIKPNKMVYFN